MTHAALIEKLGPAEVAKRMDRPISHVRVWKHRGIPRAVFADLIAAFPKDVTLDALKSGAPARGEKVLSANDEAPGTEDPEARQRAA